MIIDTYTNLNRLLTNRTYTGLNNNTDIEYQSIAFNPTGKELFMSVDYLPTQADNLTKSIGDKYLLGIYQITLFATKNNSTIKINTLADEVLEQFANNTIISYNVNNIETIILDSSLASLQTSQDYISLPITINFRSY